MPCDYDEFKTNGLRPVNDLERSKNNSKENKSSSRSIKFMSENELIHERNESENILNGFKP